MKFSKLLTFLAAGLLANAAWAVNSYQGSVWTATYQSLVDNDPLHETYRINLGVDTNAYNGGGTYLDQVALKISTSFSNLTLLNAPSGASAWNVLSGGLAANGCSGAGAGFFCFDSKAVLNNGRGVATNPGNGVGVDYVWQFNITVNNGALLLGTDAASIKARFVNSLGNKVGALVSEPITLKPYVVPQVPEPSTYMMFIAAFGLLGAVIRKRRA